jgi:hypothetical protein
MRADTSAVPPGAKPTRTRTGRVGHCCAHAAAHMPNIRIPQINLCIASLLRM